MNVIHDGKARLTRKRLALITAAKFYISALGLDNFADTTLNICFKPNFRKEENAYAQTEYIDKTLININFDAKIDMHMGLFTMAHECIHVKQYILGKLAEDNEGFQLWQGERVSSELRYYEEPWEVEAMQQENILTYTYIHHRDMVEC